MAFAVFYLASLLYQGCDNSARNNINKQAEQAQSDCPNITKPFPSYDGKYSPPGWWCQENKVNEKEYPIFQIKTDYPDNYNEYIEPNYCSEKDCPWKKYNFKSKEDQDNYMKEVIKYAFEGNLEVDWVVQKNTKERKWFHAPFMHLDIVVPSSLDRNDPQCKTNQKNDKCEPILEEKVAREFMHGLTMERPGCLSELNYTVNNPPCAFPPSDPEKNFQSWAVSFYNERGASYIREVWNEVLDPKAAKPDPQNFPSKGFPDGAVAIKLLFTHAPPDKVEYLKDSVVWKADTGDFIREGGMNKAKRLKEKDLSKEDCDKDRTQCVTELRLLQIDIAVRDERKNETDRSPTGWVFATFTYHKDAEPFIKYESSQKIDDGWLRIKPLGLIFGNDPLAKKGDEIKESILNTELGIPQHYGCGDDENPFKRRLNGPVDNPASSCISCHSQSETPKDLKIGSVPYGCMRCESEYNIAEWFRNINPRSEILKEQTFTASTSKKPMFSLDYSLQLREGIRRFCVESYISGVNKCGLNYNQGDDFTVITKQGTKTYTIQ